jgi:hypothetical protein
MKDLAELIAGHQVRATARSEQEPLVRDVFGVLRRIAASDPPRAGMTVRLGWTVLTLAADGDDFILCEPDFDRDPMTQRRPSIAASLDVLADQAAFARACGVEPVDIGFDSLLLVGRGALAAPSIQAFREPQDDPGDSGWTVTVAGTPKASDDPDDYEAIRSYRLLDLRPELLPTLVLPPKYGLIMEAGRPPRVVAPDPSG